MGEPATVLPVNKLQDQPYHELYKSAKEEVPMFEGKHTFTAESFLTKLKAAYETYAVLPEDWVKLAKTRLGGVAASFETELAAENNAENATFPVFKRKLLARFPVAPEDAAAFVLVHKTRLQGANLAKYIQDFNKQVSRAGTGEVGLQQMLQEVFLTGLGALRQPVEQAKPEGGWADLLSLQSASVQQHANTHLSRQPTRKTNSGNSRGSGSAPRASGSAPQHISNRAQKRSRLEDTQDQWCTFCKKATHMTSNCRNKKRVDEAAAGQSKKS